ncbi:MAG: HlyD family type I secretion periplasmic adaptor subunit [Bosea sp. (in: a-proteobacteria)]
MSESVKAIDNANADWRQPLRHGLVVTVLFVVGFVGWAANAPVDSAIVAPGTVAAEGSRQTIQHLEGGIIRAIQVSDGQHVQEGDVLFLLDDTHMRANYDVVASQLSVQIIREARLLAEQAKVADVVFPPDVATSLVPTVKAALKDEQDNFRERFDTRKAQHNVMLNRIGSFQREIQGLQIEQRTLHDQVTTLDRELPGLRSLLARNLTLLSRVTTLEREKSRTEMSIARTMTDIAKAERSIGEVELTIGQTESDFQKSVVMELMETRKLIAELRERLAIAKDNLSRLQIVAPKSGIAQARRFATLGAVVRPGDAMVEISPLDAPVIVKVQVDPMSVDLVQVGMRGEVRFPNFKSSELPVLFGSVRSLSNDRVTDPVNPGLFYFQVDVEVDLSPLDDKQRSRIRVGIPASVVFPTGERSAARYFLQPIESALAVALRER